MFGRYVRSLTFLSPTVLLYFVSIFVMGFVIDGGIYSVLLNLFLARLNYGPEMIGLVNSIGTLAFALGSLPSGLLGERFGSRRMLIIGLVLLVVGTFCFPLADILPAAFQLPWLLIHIFIIYAGMALYFVNNAPFIMDVVTPAERTPLFSFQTALASMAAFLGSLLSGFLPTWISAWLGVPLNGPISYRYSLLVGGFLMLIALWSMIVARPKTHHFKEHETIVDVNQTPSVAAVIAPLGMLLFMMAFVRVLQVTGVITLNTFFNVYLDQGLHVPTVQLGILMAVARLLGVPMALATAALSAKFGNRGVIIGASLGTAISILPIIFVQNWLVAGIGFVGVVGLSWMRYAASLVYFLELVPAQRRARVVGTMETATGISSTVIAFGGGYMIVYLGYSWLFAAAAFLTAISAVVFWLYFRNREPLETTPSEAASTA
jgi:MFS family permease